MADKVLAIPTVPGKDVSFHAYYPDGTPHYTLDTTRSGVLDVLMAGVAGIDAEKFAQDMRTMQWISQERAAWQAMLSPLLQAAVRRYDVQTDVRASAPPAAPPESRVLDLLQELRDLGYFPAKTSP